VETADTARLGAVQLSGHEPASVCVRLPLPWYKGFRIEAGATLDALAEYPCTAYLLDCRAPHHAAHTPLWGLGRRARRHGRAILAGGLSPSAIPEAIDGVRPWAVDLVEETEISPGVKDIERLEAIVTAIRVEERLRD